MYAEKVKSLLEDTEAKVIKVVNDFDQDPFVLYERQYVLMVKSFSTKEEIKEYFADKKMLVVKDCPDDLKNEKYVVKYWIHDQT